MLVTGASGFVGAAVLRRLHEDGMLATGAVRRACTIAACRPGPSLSAEADWRPLLAGHDVVVHAAARVHVMRERDPAPRAAYLRTNTEGTLALARQAAAAGVKRFVFISTVKVLGERTTRPFSADSPPAPCDPYAESKLEAEKAVARIGLATGMEWVIIRPPLVYGPGVRGNFATMVRWLRSGMPLPLGAIEHNRRALVALDTLTDLIATCVTHPAAANRSFLVSDGEDLSTTALLQRLAAALGVRARLVPVPVGVLRAVAGAVGKGATMARLCDSLQVDIGQTTRVLGWRPPIDVDEGLRRCATAWTR